MLERILVHIVVQFDGLQPMTYIESYASLPLSH